MPPESAEQKTNKKNTEDVSFARIALKKGYLSDIEADDAFKTQEEMDRKGMGRKPIADILLEAGKLDHPKVREVYAIQGKEEGFPRIKGYRIESKVGSGGMGTVYKARQESLDRAVAIKVLDPLLSRDRKFISRFLREARSVAKLNHENIIVGIDVGRTRSGTYFFVMEYVEGLTVFDILQEDGPIPERRSLEICRQIGTALDHANRHNLVHRDIKPDNILITAQGVAKLCDLGLAKSTFPSHRLTQAGSTHGTPHYMSPEQARGQENIDTRSDIYSLGATLYHMITGDVPFDGPSAAVILLKHISEDATPARRLNPGISEATQDLLNRMMAKKPENRHQTPADLVADIDRILAGGMPAAWKAPDAPGTEEPQHGRTPLPRPGNEAATQLYSREMAAQKRDPFAYLAWGAMAVVLAAFAAGTAIAIARSPAGAARPDGGQTKAELPVPDPVPAPPSPKSREEASARENLEYAMGWISVHPLEHEEQISRLMESVVWRYGGTLAAQKAKDQVLKVCAAVDSKVADSVGGFEGELGAMVARGDLGSAIRGLDRIADRYSFVDRFSLLDKVPALKALSARRSEFEASARKLRSELESKAAEAEAKGADAEAADILEKARDLGLTPDPSDRIAALRRKVEQAREGAERKEASRLSRKYLLGFVSPVADEIRSRDFDKAAARCGAALGDADLKERKARVEAFGQGVRICRDIWNRAMAEMERLKNESTNVLLFVRDAREPSGRRAVKGFARPAGPGSIAVFTSPKADGWLVEEIRYGDLAVQEILNRAGLETSGLSGSDVLSRSVFRAFEGDDEGAVRDMEAARRIGENPDSWIAVASDMRTAVDELAAARVYTEALERYAGSQWREAVDAFTGLKDKYSATAFFREYEEDFSRMFAEASRRLILNPDLGRIFRGEHSALAGGFAMFTYDFQRILRENLQILVSDWRSTAQPGSWKAAADGLEVSGAGLEWIGRIAGEFELDARIRIDHVTSSVGFLTVEGGGPGRILALSLNGGGGASSIEERTPGPGAARTIAENKASEVLAAGREYVVGVSLSGGTISLFLEGKPECSAAFGRAGSLRIALRGGAQGVTFLRARIKCKLEPAWVFGHNK